jgi:hypothetical protein
MALEGGEVNAGNVVTITGRSLLDKSAPPREYDKPPNGWAPRSPSSARALVENRVIKY